jgi:hypothetical protein
MRRPWHCSAQSALLRSYWLGGCVALAASLSACVAYPDSSERFDDEVTATGYDKRVDFTQFKTFSIDPVVHVVKNTGDGTPELVEMDPKYAAPLVDEVTKNMKAAGYEEVESNKHPDLGLTLTGINTLVTGTYTAWWGYGYYWGYPGYGYYYPYYYGYAYRAGSLITEMVDLKDMTSSGPGDDDAGAGHDGPIRGLPVVWSSIGYRVLDDNNTTNVAWAKSSIDQAFTQSPYLRNK